MGAQLDIDPGILETAQAYIAVRHEIHANPEVGFEVEGTAKLIERELGKIAETTEGLHWERMAGTGIVVTLESANKTSEKVIGFRADIDALPLQEEPNDLPYRSKTDGKAHLCGHDGHTAALLASIAHFAKHRDDFDGTLKFVFQPAEEARVNLDGPLPGGAEKMVEAGLFEQHRMDKIYACHNWPSAEFGKIMVHNGPVMASNTCLRIVFEGKAGHGAMPHEAINPNDMMADLTIAFRELHQELSTAEDGVLTVCHQNAGSNLAPAGIPAVGEIAATLRTFDDDKKAEFLERIDGVCAFLSDKYGGKITCGQTFRCDTTVNDEAAAKVVVTAAVAIPGSDLTYPAKAEATGEDFAAFAIAARATGGEACYYWVGQGTGDPENAHDMPLHNLRYNFNDNAIALMVQINHNIVMAELPTSHTLG